MLRFTILFCLVFYSCKKESPEKFELSAIEFPAPLLEYPTNNANYEYDTKVIFKWKSQNKDLKYSLVVFAKDEALTDTIKTIQTNNSFVEIFLSELGDKYEIYWGVFNVNSSGNKSKANTYKLTFKGLILPAKLNIISPKINEIIYQDSMPNIEVKWNKQPNILRYEIQADYNTNFSNANIQGIYNNYSLAKWIVINAPDTTCLISKIKIDWNVDLFIRARSININGLNSEWTDPIKIRISDPREGFMGVYNFEVDERNYSGFEDTTHYFYDVKTLFTEEENGSLYLSNDYINWVFHPYFISPFGMQTYKEGRFFGNVNNRSYPTGSLTFRRSANGDTSFVSGSFSNIQSRAGGTNYAFRGYKVN